MEKLSQEDFETKVGSRYYRWKPEQAKFAVELNLALVDRFSREIAKTGGGGEKPNAEIGGILLGSIPTDAPSTLRIEDMELVPCDYRSGPYYLLEGFDRARFFERRRDLALKESELQPVGLFRTHTRDSALLLSPEDHELMVNEFPLGLRVALLIKPSTTGSSEAAFFLPERGRMQEERSYLSFPFRKAQLAPLAAPAIRKEQLTAQEPEPSVGLSTTGTIPAPKSTETKPLPVEKAEPRTATQPGSRFDELLDRQERTPARRRTAAPTATLSFEPSDSESLSKAPRTEEQATQTSLPIHTGSILRIAALFVLGSLLGYFAGVNIPWNQLWGDNSKELSLAATEQSRSLRITWNRDWRELKEASVGRLRIVDGKSNHEITLSPQELNAGSVTYQRQSEDVQLALQISLRNSTTYGQELRWAATPGSKE